MRDFHVFKPTTIRYWERRRIVYNLAILLPAWFGYALADTINWVGDPNDTHYSYILPLFAISALGVNICYSFAYALEFLIGDDDPKSAWLRYRRITLFVAGVLFAMFFAFMGGWNIANMAWSHRGQKW